MTHVNPNVINAGFRGYADDVAGGITSQTAIAAANTNFSRDVGVKFHVAMRVTETAGGAANNYNYTLQYNRNGTGWNDVTTSTPIQSAAPTNCTTTNGASYGTTALSNGATIQATEYDTSGSSASNITLNNASYEQTSCLRIDGAQVNNGDTIQLRLTNNGTALNADTTIPTITAVEAGTTYERETLIAAASAVAVTASVGLTASSGVTVTSNGQVVANLDITASGTGINVGSFSNVTIRNCRISYNNTDGANNFGIKASGGSNLLIEDCEIINDGSPDRGANSSIDQNCIDLFGMTTATTIRRVTLRRGSAGIYALECANCTFQFIEGHDFRGPFFRGQLMQFNKCTGTHLVEDVSLNSIPGTSYSEDNINVLGTPNVTFNRVKYDFLSDSPSGSGLLLELGDDAGSTQSDDCSVDEYEAEFLFNGFVSVYGADNFVVTNARVRYLLGYSNRPTGSGTDTDGLSLSNELMILADPQGRGSNLTGNSFTVSHYLVNNSNLSWDNANIDTLNLTDTNWTPSLSFIRNSFSWRDSTSVPVIDLPVRIETGQASATPVAGETLYVLPGRWTHDPTSRTWQWYRDGSPVSADDVSGIAYTLTSADAGTTITVGEVASNANGSGTENVSSGVAIGGGVANLLTDGNTLDSATWSGNATKTNAVLANDGQLLCKLTSNAGTFQLCRDEYNYAGGQAYTFTFSAPDNDEYQYLGARLDDFLISTDQRYVTYDLVNRTVNLQGISGVTAGFYTDSFGKERCYYTCTPDAGLGFVDLAICTSTGSTDTSMSAGLEVTVGKLMLVAGTSQDDWPGDMGRTTAVAAVSTMTAAATVESGGTTFERDTLIAGASTVAAVSDRTLQRAASVAGASTLAAVGSVSGLTESAATISATSALGGSAVLTRYESVVFAGTSGVTAAASVPGLQERNATVAAVTRLKANWTTTTSGNVSFNAAPDITGTMSVGQTLTVNDAVTYEASAIVAAASALTVVADVDQTFQRTAAIAAASTVTAISDQTRDRAAVIAGISTVAALSDQTRDRIALVTAASTVAAVSTQTRDRAAAISASSTVTAVATVSSEIERTVAIAGGSAVTAAPTITRAASVVVAASSSLTAVSAQTRDRAAAVAATSSLTAVGDVSGLLERTVTVAGTSSVAALSAQTRDRAAAISGASTVTTAATRTTDRSTAIAGASTVTAAATVSGQAERTVAVVASSSLTVAPELTANRNAAIGATSTVSAVGDVTGSFERTVSVAASSTVTTSRERSVPRTVVIAASSTVSAVRARSSARSVAIAGGSALAVTRERIVNRAANVAGVSAVAATFSILGQSARRVAPAATSENSGTLNTSLRTGTVGRGS